MLGTFISPKLLKRATFVFARALQIQVELFLALIVPEMAALLYTRTL